MNYDFLNNLERGQYFEKKKYDGIQPFSYVEAIQYLPEIIYDAEPEWVRCYQYAIKILFDHIHSPEPESGFVSNFVDAAFNDDIFLWDTVFMTLFCNLFHPYVPGICSLDNFYCKQFDDGEIPRELVRDTGKDFLLWVNGCGKPLYSYFHNHYGHRRLKEMKALEYEDLYKPDMGREIARRPYLTLDNLNHPLLAFAEWESFCHTGDEVRLNIVSEPLYQYYQALKYHLRHQCGLYVTDWASMDNSPRNKELGLAVDTSCEMVLFGEQLLSILRFSNGERELVDRRISEIAADISQLKGLINERMWDEETEFYYDLTMDGKYIKIKTIAAFWTLLSGVAGERQAKRLSVWLEDEETFKRIHRVPVVAADEPEYDPMGGYWRGSVWAPTNAMVIMGLERYGMYSQARDIAINHLKNVEKVWEMTGSIWENYPADFMSKGNSDKKDFIGWSGLAPILYMIQYAVGLSVQRGTGELVWKIDRKAIKKGRIGCKRYWFQGKTIELYAQMKNDKIEISAESQTPFRMHVWIGEQELIKDVPGGRKILYIV